MPLNDADGTRCETASCGRLLRTAGTGEGRFLAEGERDGAGRPGGPACRGRRRSGRLSCARTARRAGFSCRKPSPARRRPAGARSVRRAPRSRTRRRREPPRPARRRRPVPPPATAAVHPVTATRACCFAGRRRRTARATAGRRATRRTFAPPRVSASSAPAAAPPAPTMTIVCAGDGPRRDRRARR